MKITYITLLIYAIEIIENGTEESSPHDGVYKYIIRIVTECESGGETL